MTLATNFQNVLIIKAVSSCYYIVENIVFKEITQKMSKHN